MIFSWDLHSNEEIFKSSNFPQQTVRETRDRDISFLLSSVQTLLSMKYFVMKFLISGNYGINISV